MSPQKTHIWQISTWKETDHGIPHCCMQLKTVGCPHPPVRMSKVTKTLQVMLKLNPQITASGSRKGCNHCEKQCGDFLNMHLPYALVIPFPRHYPKKIKSNACTKGYMERCVASYRSEAIQLSTDLWIDKEIVYTYNKKLLKATKGDETSICYNVAEFSDEYDKWKELSGMLWLASFT